MIYLIVVFKIDAFFVFLKEQLPNKSTSKNLESIRFNTLLSLIRMLLMRIKRNFIKEIMTVEEVMSSCVNFSSTVAYRT